MLSRILPQHSKSSDRAIAEPLEMRRLLTVAWSWGAGGGTSMAAGAGAVASDSSGAVYVAGTFSAVLDVEPSKSERILIPTGPGDMFVVKYSADRKIVWTAVMGGPDGQISPMTMTLDNQGGLVIVGSFQGNADFGPGLNTINASSNGGEDAFILRLSMTKGKFDRLRTFGGKNYDVARGVAANGAGELFIGGVFNKSTIFPNAEAATPSAGGKDGFVMKFVWDSTQTPVQRIGGTGADAVNGVAFDSSTGNVAIVGDMQNMAVVGSDAGDSVYLTSHGGRDAFYANYNASFSLNFAQRYGGSGDEFGDSVAINGSDAYIAGTFTKPMNSLTSNGGRDIFLKKIAGEITQIGSTGDDFMGKIAIDNAGRVILAGTYGASMTFDPGGLATSLFCEGEGDVLVAAYSSTLTPLAVTHIGGRYIDRATSLAIDPAGKISVAGTFQVWTDLGPDQISSPIHSNRDSDWYVDRFSFIL